MASDETKNESKNEAVNNKAGNLEDIKEAVREVLKETKAAEEAEAPKKKSFISEAKLEMLIAIFLGITALLTAWASWIGSLHGGNQATNYTKSGNASSDANSMYNEAFQRFMQDMMVWNAITEYIFDEALADAKGDQQQVQLIEEKIQTIRNDNCSKEFDEAIEWALENDATPFDKEGFEDSYYADAEAKYEEADALLKEGMKDNHNGDTFNLVNVLYSLVLFLLGIVGIFKNIPNRFAVFVIAVVLMLAATIYMFTIPMPTGFSIASFFGG
ncbi:MAG: hypothetical protein K5897_13200 [Eubacterium sp.]|nr:hypothetical protein [Eubacterium sp.]